jgi:hypothetical protein
MSTSPRFHAVLAVALGAIGVAGVLFFLGSVTQVAAHPPTLGVPPANIETAALKVQFAPSALMTITVTPNPVTVTVGATLTFSAAGQDENGHSTLVRPTWDTNGGSIDASGVFTAQTSVASGRLVTATSGTVSGTATVNLVAAAPYTVTLNVTPTTLTAGNNSMLTATVTDRHNNPVKNGTPVTFTVSRGSVISPVPTTDGVATSLFSDTLVGTRVVTATSGSAPPATQLVSFEPGEPFDINLVPQPPLLQVGWVSMLNMTVTDRYGNAVTPGAVVTLTADWGNVTSPAYTGQGGRAASPMVAYQAGADHITATSQTAFTVTTVTYTPDVPNSVTLEAYPAQQVVGNNTVLTATVKDQYGNSVANGTPVTFSKDLGTLFPPVAQTTNGIATARISSTLPGTAHITAASGSAPLGAATVVFQPDEPFAVALVADPALLVVGNNSVLTATVTDRYNNPVGNGTPVTFTASRGNVISPVPTTNGVATSLFSDTLVGTPLVTAASGSAPPATRLVTFTAGPPFSITAEVNPITLFANSGATASITATITDRYENPLAGEILSGSFLTATMGTISGLGVTNSAGQAIGTWTAGTRPGQAPLSVTNGVITGSIDVALISGPPTTLTMQVGLQTLIANSGMTSPITVTVVDQYGTGLTGLSVSGGVTPTTIGSLSVLDLTDDDGQAFGAWTAGTVIGPGLLQAYLTANTDISTAVAASLTFTDPHTITPQVSPSTLAAFSGATAAITATVADLYGNPVPGITLSGSTSPSTLGSVRWNAATNSNGQVLGTWTATPSSAAGNGVIRASLGIVSGTVAIALTPGSIYLPHVRGMSGILNGDFSKPNLADWIIDPNSVLNVSESIDPTYPGNPAALLGNPTYACKGGMNIGYAILSQSFAVPTAPSGQRSVLKFSYHIYTNDKNYNLNDIADRFDVLLDGMVVLKDMNQSFPYTCDTLYDLGRKEARIPLTGSAGDWVNLIFRLKNGIDRDYNTYVYIDNVRLENEALPGAPASRQSPAGRR